MNKNLLNKVSILLLIVMLFTTLGSITINASSGLTMNDIMTPEGILPKAPQLTKVDPNNLSASLVKIGANIYEGANKVYSVEPETYNLYDTKDAWYTFKDYVKTPKGTAFLASNTNYLRYDNKTAKRYEINPKFKTMVMHLDDTWEITLANTEYFPSDLSNTAIKNTIKPQSVIPNLDKEVKTTIDVVDGVKIIKHYYLTTNLYDMNLNTWSRAIDFKANDMTSFKNELNKVEFENTANYKFDLRGLKSNSQLNEGEKFFVLAIGNDVFSGKGQTGHQFLEMQAIKVNTPVKYEIQYKFGNTILEKEDKVGNDGSKVTHRPKTIPGYTPTSNSDKSIILKDGEPNIIIFDYTKTPAGKVPYTVQYKYGDKILDEDKLTTDEGTQVVHAPKVIKGYKPAKETKKALTIRTGNKNLIVFDYVLDTPAKGEVEYEIIYKAGDKVLDRDKLKGDHGDKKTHKPKNIKDYRPLNDTPQTIILDKNGKNVIVFEYQEDRPIEEILNKEDHLSYIQGYPDNTVQPEGNVTRGEVAEVFYRLLTEEYKKEVRTTRNGFGDVKGSDWYNTSVSTLANAGIITGYEDGSFKPNQKISRAELATIASRFDRLGSGNVKFTDTKGHWAERYISSAASKGWVKGYENGTFKPNQAITRAEFVTLVNNVLERNTKTANMVPGRRQFKDLRQGKWYYEAMEEAINSHEYVKEKGIEKWTKLIKDTLVE